METVKDATKVTIAFSVCTAVPLLLHWEQPAYALFTAVMLATPYLGFSIDRGILRIVGTLLAVFFSMSFIALYAQNWPAFIVACTLLCLVTCFFAAGDFYPYAFVVTCFFTIIIAGFSLLEPTTTWELAKFVAQQTIAATILTVAVYSVFWPNKAGRSLSVLYGDITKKAGDTLDHCREKGDFDATQAVVQRLRHHAMLQVGSTREILYYASRESSAVRRRYVHYQRLNSAMRDVVLNSAILATALNAPEAPPVPEHFREALRGFVDRAQKVLRDFQFKANDKDGADRQALAESHRAIQTLWFDFLAARKTFALTVLQAASMGGIMGAVNMLGDSLENLFRERDAIHQKGRAPSPRQTTRQYHSTLKLPRVSGHYRLRRALQAAASCFFGFVVFYLTDPPMGTNLWVSAVIGGAINALVPCMRFSHLMIGTALGFFSGTILLYGILQFTPNESLPLLLISAAPFVFLHAYIYSRKKTVVIGLLANLMLALLVYTGNRADFSIDDWMAAIISSFAGFAVTGVMISLIWPIRPRREFKATCQRVLDECGRMLAFWDENNPKAEGSETLMQAMDASLSGSLSRANLWLGLVNWRRRRELRQEDAEAVVIALEAFSLRMCAIEKARNAFPRPEKVMLIRPVLDQIRRALRERCEQWVHAMKTETLPPDATAFPDLLQSLEEHGQRFRQQRLAAGDILPPKDASALLRLLSRYRSAILAMERLDVVMRKPEFVRTPLGFY